MKKQANNQKTVASNLNASTLNVTAENTKSGMKLKNSTSSTKIKVKQKLVSVSELNLNSTSLEQIAIGNVGNSIAVDSVNSLGMVGQVGSLNASVVCAGKKEQSVESFNFKSEKRFLNIAKLIQANKTLDLENMLKSESINPNQRDETGATCSWTPLYWSVKLNKIECVEILLAYGADVNLVINDPLECYGTALDLATLLGHEEIETIIRKHMNKDTELRSAFKAVRTKLRGNAPAFNFKSQKRQEAEMEELEQARRNKKEQMAA